MPVNTIEEPLLVLEYGGTGRSGKGTIVNHITSMHEGAASEETGADYRLVTHALHNDGSIEFDMPAEEIEAAVGRLSTSDLSDIVADRPNFVANYGIESLYSDTINGLVSSVSPVSSVRAAVKAGFMRRVVAAADDPEVSVLLVDGRNLAAVVNKVPRTSLVMSTFVSCYDVEAAWREVDRSEGELDYLTVYSRIKKRNYDDAHRPNDPVIPDADAISYWDDDRATWATLLAIADEQYGGDAMRAAQESFHPYREFRDVIRQGAGHIAVREGRQIHFDTTHFRSFPGDSKEQMLKAAKGMFYEALQERRHPGAWSFHEPQTRTSKKTFQQ